MRRKVVPELGLPTGRGPHGLRHTFATLALSPGEDVAAVAVHLGHADPTVTMREYVHALPERSVRLGSVIDDVLNVEEG